MPYIDKRARTHLDRSLVDMDVLTPGELNYLFTKIALLYLGRNGESYQHWNDIIGALECCKLELYRRFISKYEDKKIEINGDII